MDISICFADFPTEAIGQTTVDYRQLGIGYANLGALLMATGHGYDSEGGRALAASITSLLTGAAYKRSAEMAAVVGPYTGYARNADAHKRVMRKHAAANDAVRTVNTMDKDIHRVATKAWDDVVKLGEKNGYRNAQASVLAPTGTIGFMMDCDTTGIEPDFSLVKFKKLVGGGSMQIVNLTIPRALRKLGYTEETVEAIVEYIADKGHVIDAPGLKPEHYEVFDTAMGARAISPMGHVRMMAAVQPFLSGAISKTVNLPETATVEEIEDVYVQGWKLGLKALAVYRDNCKVGQPLSDGGSTAKDAAADKASAAVKAAQAEIVEKVVYRPTRERLPEAPALPDDVVHRRWRRGLPHRRHLRRRSARRGVPQVRQAGLHARRRHGRLLDRHLGRAPVRGAAGDVRREVHEHALRAGRHDRRPGRADGAEPHGLRVPPAGPGLPRLRHPLVHGDPHGRGAGPPARDRLVRPRGLRGSTRSSRRRSSPCSMGIGAASKKAEEPATPATPEQASADAASAATVASGSGAASAREVSAEIHSSADLLAAFGDSKAADAPMCLTCGTKMRPAGSCYVCEGCGSTSGCS